MESLESVQKRTFDDMCACLEEHRLCCVERPTGFGKTKIFMDYVGCYPDERFLYIYDLNSTKQDILTKYAPTNVEFLSYAKLAREMTVSEVKKFICGQPWHTIIFDEAHLMGGPNIMKLLEDILPFAVENGVRVLGGTATPLRTDLLEVSEKFFCGFGVFEYTIMDAVRDGIMLEPIWVAAAKYETLLESLRSGVGSKSNSYVRSELSRLDKAYAQLDGVSTVYASTIEDVYGAVPDIMRFIVFYPTIQAIEDNMTKDERDFSKAFPEHTVVSVALTSSVDHMGSITEVEESFTCEGKQVQLIFAVDMLNQSYHSTDLTGIVMHRATLSNIMFTQQLGRVMSVVSEKPGIVFDSVGNVFVRPERITTLLGLIVDSNSTGGKKTSGEGRREPMELRVRAAKELVEFSKVYNRILAAREITQEQIDCARANWARHKHHLSWDDFYSITGMPRFMVEETEHDNV